MSLRKVGIFVTQNAWTKMRDILCLSENKFGFLFSATSGGCSGFSFNLDLMDKKVFTKLTHDKLKPTIIEGEKTKVYVDPFSEIYLMGTSIDYIKEDYSKGQFESKFVFDIDKELDTRCGCGISFNPKN